MALLGPTDTFSDRGRLSMVAVQEPPVPKLHVAFTKRGCETCGGGETGGTSITAGTGSGGGAVLQAVSPPAPTSSNNPDITVRISTISGIGTEAGGYTD